MSVLVGRSVGRLCCGVKGGLLKVRTSRRCRRSQPITAWPQRDHSSGRPMTKVARHQVCPPRSPRAVTRLPPATAVSAPGGGTHRPGGLHPACALRRARPRGNAGQCQQKKHQKKRNTRRTKVGQNRSVSEPPKATSSKHRTSVVEVDMLGGGP